MCGAVIVLPNGCPAHAAAAATPKNAPKHAARLVRCLAREVIEHQPCLVLTLRAAFDRAADRGDLIMASDIIGCLSYILIALGFVEQVRLDRRVVTGAEFSPDPLQLDLE